MRAANYKAIAAVGQAIVNILREASRNEFPEAELKLFQTTDFARVDQHPNEGVSVCLFQVELDPTLRDSPFQDETPDNFRSAYPIALRLRFLITPWARDPQQQYLLLGWILDVLHGTPILRSTLLNQIDPDEDVFPPDLTVRLILEPLSLSDVSSLLESLQQPAMLPSLAYTASLELGGSSDEFGG